MNHWLSAFRLRTLPLALASIGMGGFLAAADNGFRIEVFVLALLTTMALQILSNLANDYGDSVHGADNDSRSGPSRAVQAGLISSGQMKVAIGLAGIVSLFLGVSLLMISEVSLSVFLTFAALGIVAILAAVLYTNGETPYGYLGLGDISVFLFFGLLGVIGTYYLMTGAFSWILFLPGISCGLLTVAVLNVNNIRDIDSDLIAGKKSIPVRLGRKKATIYHCTLLIVSVFSALAYIIINYESPKQFLFLLVLPLLFINARAVTTKLTAQGLDPYLKQMAISTLIFVLFFGISIIL